MRCDGSVKNLSGSLRLQTASSVGWRFTYPLTFISPRTRPATFILQLNRKTCTEKSKWITLFGWIKIIIYPNISLPWQFWVILAVWRVHLMSNNSRWLLWINSVNHKCCFFTLDFKKQQIPCSICLYLLYMKMTQVLLKFGICFRGNKDAVLCALVQEMEPSSPIWVTSATSYFNIFTLYCYFYRI